MKGFYAFFSTQKIKCQAMYFLVTILWDGLLLKDVCILFDVPFFDDLLVEKTFQVDDGVRIDKDERQLCLVYSLQYVLNHIISIIILLMLKPNNIERPEKKIQHRIDFIFFEI